MTHRTIILPGLAILPGHTLIPNRRPAESLPLLVDPPAFFVAFRTEICMDEFIDRRTGEWVAWCESIPNIVYRYYDMILRLAFIWLEDRCKEFADVGVEVCVCFA